MKYILSFLLFLSTAFIFSPTFAASPTPTAMVEQKSEYTLPYPGILPDHPLFFLKKIRDQIMEKLVSDPVRKVEFYQLQADKYMNMGVFLFAKNKEAAAVETMMIGVEKINMAIQIALSLKEQGKDVPEFVSDRLMFALVKYSELTLELPDGRVKDEIRNLQDEASKLSN